MGQCFWFIAVTNSSFKWLSSSWRQTRDGGNLFASRDLILFYPRSNHVSLFIVDSRFSTKESNLEWFLAINSWRLTPKILKRCTELEFEKVIKIFSLENLNFMRSHLWEICIENISTHEKSVMYNSTLVLQLESLVQITGMFYLWVFKVFTKMDTNSIKLPFFL